MNFLFFYVEPISLLLPVGFLLMYSLHDKRAKIKILAAYYFLAAILMWKANFLSRQSNNLEDYRFLVLLTNLFLGYYFYASMVGRWRKSIPVLLTVVNVIYYIGHSVVVENSHALDSVGYAMLSFCVALNVVLFMYQTISNVTDEPLSINFDFWFVAAQMVYHCGSFVIFLSYGYFTKRIQQPNQYTGENRNILMQLWNGHNILLLICSVMICCLTVWITVRKNRWLKKSKS